MIPRSRGRLRLGVLVSLAVVLDFVVPVGLAGENTPTESALERPIVVRNAYWAKPGLEEEVYRHRLHASAVRASVGLPAGRVLQRLGGPDSAPDVVWECQYPSEAARAADVEALTASGVFEPVMERMGTLIERFERTVWRLAPDGGLVEAAGAETEPEDR